jgi:outer membrane protein OmpA-like peptidoglycan-associated protein
MTTKFLSHATEVVFTALIEVLKGTVKPTWAGGITLFFLFLIACSIWLARPKHGKPRPAWAAVNRTNIRWVAAAFAGLLILAATGRPLLAWAYKVFWSRNLILQIDAPSGAGIAGIEVCLYRPEQSGQPGLGRVTDHGGQAVFENIPSGLYRVIAIRRTGSSKAQILAQEIQVGDDQRPFRLTFLPKEVPIQSFEATDFEVGKAELENSHIRMLRSVETSIPPGARGYWVLVFGHCDQVGGDELNDELGTKRCLTVLSYLQSLKLEASRFRSFSYGRRHLAEPGYYKSCPRNRRVECILLPDGIGDMEAP